jgi:methylthioribose-1-phosphate isomerase
MSHAAPAQAAPDWFTLRWRDGALELLDQRALPEREEILRLTRVEDVALAIESMAVRGAPAIGCTAAFGLACAASEPVADVAALRVRLREAEQRLAATRPTAVNLFWALGRMRGELDVALGEPGTTPARVAKRAVAAAQALLDEDVACCRAIGRAALPLVRQGARIFTHCNAGGLATAGYGTALGVVRAAAEAGRGVSVVAGETRPFLQGARLTAWELARDGIPVTVVTDGMAGFLMRRGEVDLVVVGADRIARCGDVANKIGTYGLAVLARAHQIPFYVAAPRSTFDLATPDGDAIPIEERGRAEVATLAGRMLVPPGVPVRHPAFDVTPGELVTAIVSEAGIARPPYTESLAELLQQPA